MTSIVQRFTDFLHVVEVGDKWPAATRCMFSLLPKTVESDKPMVLRVTQISWWLKVRADIMEPLEMTQVQLSGMRRRKQEELNTIWEVMLAAELF